MKTFLSKNKEDILNKIINELRVKIRGEEAVQSTANELRDSKNIGKDTYLPLETYDLENKYNDFERKLRQMKSENEINEFENDMIKAIVTLRPIWVETRALINQVEKLLDENNDNQAVQENRKKLFEFLLDLGKYNPPHSNKLIELMYSKRRHDINRLIQGLLKKLREEALNRLTAKKQLLEAAGIPIDQNLFTNHQQKINQANAWEIQKQKYENEFLTKVLERQQSQPQTIQAPEKKA